MNRIKQDEYDIHQYTDQELLQFLDINHPTDRELEARIHQLLEKYHNATDSIGKKLYRFVQDIYQRFFDLEDDIDPEEEEEPHNGILEGFASSSNNLVSAAPPNLEATPPPPTPTPTTITTLVPSNNKGQENNNNVNYQKTLDYTKGKLNPLLKETIQRVISIDSQFRDIKAYPYSTDFTFNLSETLHDVVSMKLYSIQIPYAWYTINDNYGSNFFYIKGNSPGIADGNHNLQVSIPSGNYTISDIINGIRKSLKNVFAQYTDIDFGNTDICYNAVNGKSSFVIDIKNNYNETYYALEFPDVQLPQVPLYYITFNNIPYMNFSCITPYYTAAEYNNVAYNDISINIPPPATNSIAQLPAFYGYNGSDLINTIQHQFNQNPYTTQSTIVQTTPDSSNILIDISINYYISGSAGPNFSFDLTNTPMNNYTPYDIPLIYSQKQKYIIGNSPHYTNDISGIFPPTMSIYDSAGNPSNMFHIKVHSTGPKNNRVPTLQIDISSIYTSLTCASFCSIVNPYLSHFNQYNVTTAGSYFTTDGSSIIFDISIAAVLTNQDYQLTLYDSNIINNMWYNYLYLPTNAEYNLAQTHRLAGTFPVVNKAPTSAAIVTNENQVDTLQQLLGYKYNNYSTIDFYSNSLLGSVYNSSVQYPNIALSSTYLANAFTVHLYQPTIYQATPPLSNANYTHAYQYNNTTQEFVYDNSWSIGYSGLSANNNNNNNNTLYSYYQIIQAINASIAATGVFTPNSGIVLVDSATKTAVPNLQTAQLTNTNYYQFKLTLQFDRTQVYNGDNMKTAVFFNDPIWTDINLFKFEIILNNFGTNAHTFRSFPYVYLTCTTPGYIGPIYDISFTVPSPFANGYEQGYTNAEYLSSIDAIIRSSYLQRWGLYGYVNNANANYHPTMYFNINHIISQTSAGSSNFVLDMSSSIFQQFNPSAAQHWRFPSSGWTTSGAGTQYTVPLTHLPAYFSVTPDNNTLYIYWDPVYGNPYKDPLVTLKIPSINPYSVNDINHTTYTIIDLVNTMNNYVLNNTTNPDIYNTNVHLQGTQMGYDPTTKNLTITFTIKAVLTCKDYNVYYYDPSGYAPNVTNSLWQSYTNSWYNFFHLADPSYAFANLSPVDTNGTYAIEGTQPLLSLQGADYIEMSNIISENRIASNIVAFDSQPYAYFRCITPGYSGYANDNQFIVKPPNSLGYTNAQYLNEIQTEMNTLQSWGLTSSVTNTNNNQNYATFNFSIYRTIPQASNNNSTSNFIIDLSGTVFYSLFSSQVSQSSWIFGSQTIINTVNCGNAPPPPFIDVSYTNNTIYVYSIGANQNVTSTLVIPTNPRYTMSQLLSTINSLFNENATSIHYDSSNVSLYGSTIEYNSTSNIFTVTISVRAILTCKDYAIDFYDPNGYPKYADTPPVWINDYNTWYYYLGIEYPSYTFNTFGGPTSPHNTAITGNNTYTITGNRTVVDKNIYLTQQNNYFNIIPYTYAAKSGVYTGDTANHITIHLSNLATNQLYSIIDIVNEINLQFDKYQDPHGHGNTTRGSCLYVNDATNNAVFRLNINTTFTAKDYNLDFFDNELFIHCSYGYSSSVQTVTWDTTLGWLLGFRSSKSYNLTPENMTMNTNPLATQYTLFGKKFNSYYMTFPNNTYFYDVSTNICSITGDTAISVNLYNYFLLLLNDYTQNHLNDGLVTITNSSVDVPLTSYTARNSAYRCNPTITANSNPVSSQYIGNAPDPLTNNNLTANQIYSANQILQAQNTVVNNPYQTSLGPYIQDIFALVPMKTTGLNVGQSYVEFGGTLQNQDRSYFGPVNIKRMSIKLLTDKGTVLNLNNANWSFSLLIQQLYTPQK